jgi:translation initiation factor 2B subunit (eIF-2B alpha/beta/delta family)
VLVGESRPRTEGRALAAALAAAGLPVTLVVDAALPGSLDARSTVLLGADRLTEADVVCKVGAYALALAAARARRPTIVVADTSKVLPAALAPIDLDEHDAAEVGAVLTGVRVRNVSLERVPLRLVSRIMTEAGIWTRGEVRRHALRLPRRLARGLA